MARYIKVNPKVAAYLNLQNDRFAVKDGNYILWQADMLAFGPLTRLPETLAAIGAIALMPHEAREEQDGTTLRPLPAAADPRFIVPASAMAEPETPAEPEGNTPAAESTGNADTATAEPETSTTERTSKKAIV